MSDFNAAKTRPRTSTAQRAAITQSLPKLVREASELLQKRIDPMVSLFRRSHPDFVAGYENARVIVDRVATHKTKAAPSTPNP